MKYSMFTSDLGIQKESHCDWEGARQLKEEVSITVKMAHASEIDWVSSFFKVSSSKSIDSHRYLPIP